MRLRCESCGTLIFIERDKYALDKHGDVLCYDCHVKAVLLLKQRFGLDWEGVTFGYELSQVVEVKPDSVN